MIIQRVKDLGEGQFDYIYFNTDTGEQVDWPVGVPFWRTPYNYDVAHASNLHGEANFEPSSTIQSHSDDADINIMMARMGQGVPMPQALKLPTYGDFSDASDYQSCLNVVRAAQEQFETVPADIRARFANNPGAFLDFVQDEKNIEELRKMGLAKAIVPKVESIQKVEIVNPAPPVSEPSK